MVRRRGADIPRFMDAAAPGLLAAQAIGRVGNYFNQELFGKPTGLPWGLGIDTSHRPSAYEHFATFHPTFLYELTWNLVLAGALVWLGHHRRIRPPGLFALYIAGYSGFRIIEELLRVDPASTSSACASTSSSPRSSAPAACSGSSTSKAGSAPSDESPQAHVRPRSASRG